MKKYVLRRALIAIPTFFGITVLVFLISSMASGSPLELLLNNQNISAAEVERQRIKLGRINRCISSISPGSKTFSREIWGIHTEQDSR